MTEDKARLPPVKILNITYPLRLAPRDTLTLTVKGEVIGSRECTKHLTFTNDDEVLRWLWRQDKE